MRDSNPNKALPLWVEVLFIQIGLPDKWLRSFLKTRRRGKIMIKENKNAIGFTTIILITLTYFYPIIKQYKIHKECVENSNEYIRSKIADKELLSNKEISVVATNFCNGGIL